LYKDRRSFFPEIIKFRNEKVNWIAEVHTYRVFDYRGGSSSATAGVEMGISPYRLIFVERGIIKFRCRSFWFKLNLKGEVYPWKKLFKTIKYKDVYTSLEYKKRKKIDIAIKGVTADKGKIKNIVDMMDVSWIKGFDPSTGKYKRKYRDNVFEILDKMYKNSIPVPLDALRILRYETPLLFKVKLPTKRE